MKEDWFSLRPGSLREPEASNQPPVTRLGSKHTAPRGREAAKAEASRVGLVVQSRKGLDVHSPVPLINSMTLGESLRPLHLCISVCKMGIAYLPMGKDLVTRGYEALTSVLGVQ